MKVAQANRRSIYNALPIVAAAYAERFDVDVEVGGNVAYTNGKKIVVPNIPEDYPHMDAVWGYLAHEAAHIRYTDFSVERKKGLHSELTNIIEDCRIEREMMKLYPGTVHTLNATAEYMLNAGHYGNPDEDDNHPATVLSMFILFWLQANVVGQSVLLPILDKTRVVFESIFPAGVVVRLNALLRKAADVKSTQATANLAADIMKMVEEEKENEDQKNNNNQQKQPDQKQQHGKDQQQGQTQQQSQQQGQDQQDGQGSADTGNQQDQSQQQGGGQGGDQDGEEGGEANSGQGQQQSGGDTGNQSGTDGTDQPQSKGGSQASGDQGQDSTQSQITSGSPSQGGGSSSAGGEKSQSKLLQSVLDAGGSDLLGDVRDALKADLNAAQVDKGTTNYMTVRKAPETINNDVAGRKLLAEVGSATSKIRSQLFGLVQASQRSTTRNVREGKRFDNNRLARLATGDMKVFRTTHERQRPNTALHLLVDLSGSMDKVVDTKTIVHPDNPAYTYEKQITRADVAKESALAIAWALAAIPGANPAVTYFGGEPSCPVRSVVKHGGIPQQRAGHFGAFPDGGTPMAEAIWYGAYELSKTKEERKVLIVVTDGAPNGGTAGATQSVIERCENSGFEVYGIGIASSDVKRFFRQSIVVNDVADLQGTLFKLMERAICAPAA